MPITTSPTIVIPGITASVLHDEYELPPEAVWTAVRNKRYDRITLHPEDQRYELLEPARVSSVGPFPLIYEDLTEELRDGLAGRIRQRGGDPGVAVSGVARSPGATPATAPCRLPEPSLRSWTSHASSASPPATWATGN